MNKRGDFTGVIFLIVSVAIFAIFLLIVGYIAPQISNAMAEQIGTTQLINDSLGATTRVAENTLPTLWMIMFGGLLLGLIATSFFIKSHPIFLPIFALLLVVAIIVAIPLSNAYEELADNAILAGAAAQQGVIAFIMNNLPLTTFFIGLISMIIAFAKPGGEQASLA